MKKGTEGVKDSVINLENQFNVFNKARQECAKNAGEHSSEVLSLVLALIKSLNGLVEKNKNDDSAIKNAIEALNHTSQLLLDNKTPQTYEEAGETIHKNGFKGIANLMREIGKKVQEEGQKCLENQKHLNDEANIFRREYGVNWEVVAVNRAHYEGVKQALYDKASFDKDILEKATAITQQLDKMVNQVDKMVNQASHDYLHPADALNHVTTALEALNDTSKLLSNEMTPKEYQDKAQKYKAIGFKVLGTLMMALSAVMLTLGTGLTVTGIGTAVGASLLAGAGAMGLSGFRFFKQGQEKDALRKSMLDFAATSPGIICS